MNSDHSMRAGTGAATSPATWRTSVARYAVATGAVALTLGIKYYITLITSQESPFLLAIFGVIVAALFGGLGPGLYATALTSLSVDYLFFAPHYSLAVDDPSNWLQFAAFGLQGVIVSYIVAALKDARLGALRALDELRDATRRRERAQEELLAAQKALADSEERFRSTYSAVGQTTISTERVVVKVNRAFAEMLGYTEDELVGRRLWELIYPDDREDARQAWERLLAGSSTHEHVERRYLHKQGHAVATLVSAAAVRDAQGITRHVVSVIQDISARKHAEDELRVFAQHLERSNKDLEQFAYVASHDLQEPLRVMAGYLQLLERRYRGRLDSDADEFIDFTVGAAKRMQMLINDLLAYSRVGRYGKPFESVDATAALERALNNLQAVMREHGALVTYDPLPTLTADGTQLAQVFQNLVGNGIKFHGPRAPVVHVSAARGEDEWCFSVRDNGIGIDPQHRERVFLIFQRLHTHQEYPGTGIGLAICHKIVERHGGRVWVESVPGEGSTFFFTIPDALPQAGREDLSEVTRNLS